jgi:hypothetical protein
MNVRGLNILFQLEFILSTFYNFSKTDKKRKRKRKEVKKGNKTNNESAMKKIII